MLHLKNLVSYIPASGKKERELYDFLRKNDLPVIFYCDETGLDWYESQTLFEKDTIKVAYDERGTIRDYNNDASAIVPNNLSVIELLQSEVPSDINRSGEWVIENDEVKPLPVNYQEKALEQKMEWLKLANDKIEILQDAQVLGMATEQEKSLLEKWKQFRVMVNRISTDNAPNLSWPSVPEEL
ncbi:tail fiber assembly protein [Pantoea sp. MBD-2R]|uniref:tail fiber assembly protein n=1 Tax=Pantoea sp. MBD-2R TaxID=3141540 RepID=UPI0031831C0A